MRGITGIQRIRRAAAKAKHLAGDACQRVHQSAGRRGTKKKCTTEIGGELTENSIEKITV
jgi:hypothetical protein